MKAAIYARYSTVSQSEASIEDQLRVCERIAERHGFQIVATFQDAAISGGTTSRPGYQRLLTAARRGEFSAIVAEDTSRLWRNLAEQSPRLAELSDLGIHVVTHDLDTRHESAEIMGAVGGAMASAYRREIGRRTRRGLEGLARQQKSTGGRAYGYASATDSPTGRREIDPDQSAIVVRIFQLYADGYSPRAIAEKLNSEGIPSPGAAWKRTERRRAGWLVSAIGGDPSRGIGILNNDLYQGTVVWNRFHWIRGAADSKKRRAILNPRAEWITHHDESLRIIPDALWQAVKTRQNRRQHQVGERIKAGLKAGSAGRTGRQGRFLLSGTLRCHECGANFVMISRTHYGCAGRTNGGKSCCSNEGKFRRDAVETALLAGIRTQLAQPAVISEVARRVRARLRQLAAPRIAPAGRAKELEAEIGRLVDAIAQVGLSEGLAGRLRKAEAELSDLQRAATPKTATVEKLLPDIEARYLRMLEQLPATLVSVDPVKARAELADKVGPLSVVTTPTTIEFYSEKGRMEAAFLRAAGMELPAANMIGSGGRI